MAVFTTDNLPKYDPDNLPATVKKLHDYTVSLTEMLRFVLMNLDEDNVPELGNLSGIMEDAQGNLSQIQQTAEGILTRVENAEGDLSTVLQTADQLTTRVQNAEGDISMLTQDAEGLAARIYSAEIGMTSIIANANGIETRVEDLSGKYSSLKQTVDGFDFTGMVTFRALEREGESVINGSNITTGDLHVSSDGVGALYFYDGAAEMENIVGAFEVYSHTYPDLFIESRNGNNIRIMSDAHLSVETGSNAHIYFEADDYVQVRAGGVDYFFRADGIYRGDQKIAPV